MVNDGRAGTAGSLLSVNVGLPKDVAWHGKGEKAREPAAIR